MMTPEFYERVCRICYDALQHEAPQRSSFLDRACAGAEITVQMANPHTFFFGVG
jgi:hypothetical protein